VITVLYEDALGAATRNFGPHQLVLACVADALGDGRDHWTLRSEVKAVPKKGAPKVRVALRDEPWWMAGPLLAVFDGDRVRELYGLEASACRSELLSMILAESRDDPTIVLLERNMEDVTSACRRALGRPVPMAKPTPAERDAICHAAAAAAEPLVRSVILSAVPSLARLVEHLRGRLAG
jgi:hypothetical protein